MTTLAAEAQAFKSVDELVAERLLTRGLNRGECSRKFDKAGLSKCHMAAAREFRKLADEEVASPRVFHLLELERGTEKLESLQKIAIRYDIEERCLAWYSRTTLKFSHVTPAFVIQRPGPACDSR